MELKFEAGIQSMQEALEAFNAANEGMLEAKGEILAFEAALEQEEIREREAHARRMKGLAELRRLTNSIIVKIEGKPAALTVVEKVEDEKPAETPNIALAAE